jgi:hypothetical protein
VPREAKNNEPRISFTFRTHPQEWNRMNLNKKWNKKWKKNTKKIRKKYEKNTKKIRKKKQIDFFYYSIKIY